MEQIFRQVRQLIADKDFTGLAQLDIPKPKKFNWVKEIFEGIHVKETPTHTALLWTNGSDVNRYSFEEISNMS